MSLHPWARMGVLRGISNFAERIYAPPSAGPSSLFTTTNLSPRVHPPLNTIPKGQLPINSRRGTHELVVYKEETTWVGSRGSRGKRAKAPLVNARWERYSLCGIRCRAERVRGCGLRSCHVSARIGEALGHPVTSKNHRPRERGPLISLRFIAPRQFRARIWHPPLPHSRDASRLKSHDSRKHASSS